MIGYLNYFCNVLFFLSVGLVVLKYFINLDLKKGKTLLNETTKLKLKFCDYAKYIFIIFVVLKVIVLILASIM